MFDTMLDDTIPSDKRAQVLSHGSDALSWPCDVIHELVCPPCRFRRFQRLVRDYGPGPTSRRAVLLDFGVVLALESRASRRDAKRGARRV